MSEPRTLSLLAQRKVVDELIRRDLVAFIRRSFETVAPGETLRLNWHIHAMAHALEQVRRGKIKRLIITIPPRHLKSITTSVAFPAFLLGHDPSTKIRLRFVFGRPRHQAREGLQGGHDLQLVSPHLPRDAHLGKEH